MIRHNDSIEAMLDAQARVPCREDSLHQQRDFQEGTNLLDVLPVAPEPAIRDAIGIARTHFASSHRKRLGTDACDVPVMQWSFKERSLLIYRHRHRFASCGLRILES